MYSIEPSLIAFNLNQKFVMFLLSPLCYCYMKKDFQLAKFINDDFTLEVKVDINDNTVWLAQKEITKLFDVSADNIGLHIKNI